MDTKKIAVIGTHSTGKSTLCFRLAYYFKTLNYNVDLIDESVRYSPFPFNEKMSLETALWFYHVKVTKELESIAKKHSLIVSDRSPLDSFIYAEHFGITSEYFEQCKRLALTWLESYNRVIFLRPDIELVEDGVRSADESFRNSVDSLFFNFLNDHYHNNNLTILNSSEVINAGSLGSIIDIR